MPEDCQGKSDLYFKGILTGRLRVAWLVLILLNQSIINEVIFATIS